MNPQAKKKKKKKKQKPSNNYPKYTFKKKKG